MPDPTADDLAPPATSRHVMWLLKRAFHQGHRSVNDATRAFGVTPTQVGVLNRLSHEPGLSGADLARRLLVTPQAAQLAITSLEDAGLVERRPDPKHGRIVRAYLTASGRRTFKKVIDRSLSAEDDFLSVLSKKEVDVLVDLLSRLTMRG